MNYINEAHIKTVTWRCLVHALFSVAFRLCNKEQVLIY